jgi:CO/xanthine dehydrogenase Mo-binding subunit
VALAEVLGIAAEEIEVREAADTSLGSGSLGKVGAGTHAAAP